MGILSKEDDPPGWAGRYIILPVRVDAFIDSRNFLHPCVPLFMWHRHDGFPVPMEMVRNERYLLEDILQGVAYDSPRRPNSLSNLAEHSGQVT